MELWLWVLAGILSVIIVFLSVRLYLMRKAAKEIESAFADRLAADTNTLIDISSRDRAMRRLAAAVNTQLRKLRSERHRYQQGDAELKDAVTGISHDLRTPLTAICGYLDLLEKEEKSKKAERYLSVIQSRTEALKQLTEELFRYSLVASVHGDTVLEVIVLNHVLTDSLSAYYGALKSSGITPQITLPETNVSRRLDKNAVARILGNVISNAVKYSAGDLDVTLTESGEIIFSNAAPALDKVQAEKLFDRFYTVETAKKSSGLGLSIAKVLTEQMNGSITARYDKGRLCIHLLFP